MPLKSSQYPLARIDWIKKGGYAIPSLRQVQENQEKSTSDSVKKMKDDIVKVKTNLQSNLNKLPFSYLTGVISVDSKSSPNWYPEGVHLTSSGIIDNSSVTGGISDLGARISVGELTSIGDTSNIKTIFNEGKTP